MTSMNFSPWLLPRDGTTLDQGLITTLNSQDVLLGRGASCDRFAGNIQFRALIRERKAEYSAAPTCEKKNIARQIVVSVQAAGGRFLRRSETVSDNQAVAAAAASAADDPTYSDTVPTWRIVHQDVAVEKVKQALRDMNSSEESKTTTREAAVRQVTNGTTSPPPLPVEPEGGSVLNDVVAQNEATAIHAGQPSAVNERSTANEPRAEELAIVHELLSMRTAPVSVATAAAQSPENSNQVTGRLQEEGVLLEALGRNAAPEFLVQAAAQVPLSSFHSTQAPVAHLSQQQLPMSMSSLLQSAVWQIQQEQQWQQAAAHAVSVNPSVYDITASVATAASQLDTATAVRVSTAWREIPGNYLQMLPVVLQQGGPPFTGRDLQILLLARAFAEAAYDFVAFERIRFVFSEVVRLPTSQLQLNSIQMTELIQALHEASMNGRASGNSATRTNCNLYGASGWMSQPPI